MALDWDRIRKGARELGIKRSTVRMWKVRNRIPHKWHRPLFEQRAATWGDLLKTIKDNPPST